MQSITGNTALLFFSRTAAAEAISKRLLNNGKKQNYNAVASLIQRSHRIAEKAGLPIFIFNENQQKGNSFGEKLSASVQSVFEKGFEKIIVIGNDCPQLTALHIQQAALQLEIYDQVLAPTKKGGVSLMGICGSNFNQKEFENIRWQSAHVYDDMLSLANSTNTSIFHFPFLNDVNNNKELQHELNKLSASDSFKIIIQSILASFYKSAAFCNFNFFCNNCLNASGLRAPPASFQ